MQNHLADVEQRVKRYWYTDGIAELIGGGMFILMGIYFALQEFLGADSLIGGILQVSLVLVLIGGMWMGRRLIHFLKDRLTYPRTGYVEYQVDEHKMQARRIWVAALAFVISALTMIFVRTFDFFDSVVAVTGIGVGLILVILRAKASGITRFYLLGMISVLLGLVLAVSGLPNGYSLGLFYSSMGICFILSGAWMLQHYLRENPLLRDAGHSDG